jgi:RNA recognition motif-containing protein
LGIRSFLFFLKHPLGVAVLPRPLKYFRTTDFKINMSCKLFIGSLSWNTDDTTLRACFEQFGAVADSVVIRDRETGRSRGFGFVTFEEESMADAAVSQMDNQEFEGRTIRVSKAQERQEGERRPFNGGERRQYGDRQEGGEHRQYGDRQEGGGRRQYGDRQEGGGRRPYGDRSY